MVAAESALQSTAHIGRVALRVTDLDRLVEWYGTVVGLTVQRHEDERAVLGTDTTPLLELVAAPNAPKRGRDAAGLFHTAFRVPSREALADALVRVREQGELTGASDHLVSEALYLTDPEDNSVEIYRDRPREDWPTGGDGVGMDTLALDLDDLQSHGQNRAIVPDDTTVGHVHLEVSSLPTSRAFYVDGLGLRVRDRYGEAALFVAAGDYHHHIGLNTWNGRTEPCTGRGLHWFELVVPDREALGAVQTRLDEQGIESTSTETGLDVTDPNGIDIRLRTATDR